MSKLSIIIPSRAEKTENLNRTLQSIYENATGDFEVIIGLNGEPWTEIEPRPNLRVIRLAENIGIKGMINLLAASARGKYIYKSDAHCRFGKGFDEILQRDMQDDWIVMPRFKIIKDDWSIQTRDRKEEFYDYFFLSCPFTDPRGFRFKAGGHWPQRTQERLVSHPTVDEIPQIHGSGWFMTKDRFFELGGFPNIDIYGHAQEPAWLALKNWLMGGKVMVNKNTWYAHLHQSNEVKGYHYTREEERVSYDLAARYFVGDKGHYLHNFEWFVDKFMPMPTWEPYWKKALHKWQEDNHGI